LGDFYLEPNSLVNSEETLATRMARGPLPLGFALRCATDVASNLRELHETGRAHGSVDPKYILLGAQGALLLAPNGHAQHAVSVADVSAFGALLYEMVTGIRPSDRLLPGLPPPTPRAGPSGLRIAATRLASRCLYTLADGAGDMQKVVTEVRLLSVLARQTDVPPEGTAVPGFPGTDMDLVAPREPKDVAATAPMTLESFLRAPGIPHPLPSGVQCPRCKGRYVYPSRPRSSFEQTLLRWERPLLRCHRCLHRYFVFGRFHIAKRSPI
jgi:hypothetical protein